VPEWARVEFYTTMNDALVPLANYSTVMVETQEEPHRGNEQFFVALRQLYEKYPNVLAFLKVDDDTFINWLGLQSMMDKRKLNSIDSRERKIVKYMGNCNW
jgi:hypothetical protein